MTTRAEQDIAGRYAQFQEPAKAKIARDFAAEPSGKFLLVIPTAGGKTKTAMGAVARLYAEGTLETGNDKVVWVAHRDSLIVQAKEALKKQIEDGETALQYGDIDIVMLGRLPQLLDEDVEHQIKLVVIDEAHHTAAPSYQRAMNDQNIGVLGLTATPSRHDGLPLQFEKESYSIGFPDLVRLGVILRPEIVRIDGSSLDVGELGPDALEAFNNEPRNASIVETIKANHAKFNKIVIFVGTIKHARSLHQVLLDHGVAQLYESVAYIDGKGNSRQQDPIQFFEEEKNYKRSIVVSVDKLTEGYDDPLINTVIMARPLQSKLFYMQAIGRAIRLDPSNDSKCAFIVEIDDKLPNIRHKIDNRWLFADISDILEPAVEDVSFSSDINETLTELYDRHQVQEPERRFIQNGMDGPFSLLLFKKYQSSDSHSAFPVILHAGNRTGAREKFNGLSERLTQPSARRQRISKLYNHTPGNMDLRDDADMSTVVEAMKNAAALIYGENDAEFIDQGYPWVTFVTLRQVQNALEDFCAAMINRQDILAQCADHNIEDRYVVRLPLTLGGFWGELFGSEDVEELDRVVAELRALSQSADVVNTQMQMNEVLMTARLPISPLYYQCLVPLTLQDAKDFRLKLKS